MTTDTEEDRPDCDIDGCCHPASYKARDKHGKTHVTCTDHSGALHALCWPEKCEARPSCHNDATPTLHPCPYDSDISGDHSDKCRCCVDCRNECAADI